MRNQCQKIWIGIIFEIGEYSSEIEVTGIYEMYFKLKELANSKAHLCR